MSDLPQAGFQRRVVLFPEALLVLDTNATIKDIDARMLKIFGWESAQELIGKNFFDLTYEQDKQNVQQAFQKILTENHIADLQCMAIKKDGTYLKVSLSGTLFSKGQDDQKDIILVVHDITPHLSELEQVREAERQLTEAQEIAHFGSWVWDITSDKFRWTDEMYKLFGLTPQSYVNNDSLMAYVLDEDREKVKNFISQSLEKGSSVLDFRIVNPEINATQWMHSRSKTFYDSNHKPLRMVGIVHDITHDKEIDQVKTQFLSMASHQMRGPLTTINWNAEMLLQQQAGGLSESQQKYIQELYNASKRIVQLTNDLLTVSELELGRMPFKPETLSLVKVAKRVIEDFQHTITEKKIILKQNYSADLPDIVTDFFLLKTVMHELIGNAVNYTPPDASITLSISVDTSRAGTFLLTINDSGFGIPKAEQEKVFTKMFRATNAKAKVMGGTGLGLYIVKLIMKLTGGDIRFTSEENKGTTFTVLWPFKPANIDNAIKIL